MTTYVLVRTECHSMSGDISPATLTEFRKTTSRIMVDTVTERRAVEERWFQQHTQQKRQLRILKEQMQDVRNENGNPENNTKKAMVAGDIPVTIAFIFLPSDRCSSLKNFLYGIEKTEKIFLG